MKSNCVTSRIVSVFMAVLMVIMLIPFTVGAEITDTRVSDPSTMNDWTMLYGEQVLSTEFAGGVWTDKSVFTSVDAFENTGIVWEASGNNFLVALSAIASTESVTGLASVPTDTMMVLDISSSMYPQRNPATIQTMLNAVNESIANLQQLNENNRVGVVIYYGGQDRNQSDASNSMVLLPLDRYTNANETFLVANVSNNLLQSVAVNANVTNSSGATVAQTTRTVTDVAGTYAQLGILDALSQFEAADTVIPATASYQPGVTRVPIMIFMSDGEPTAATHQYTQKVDAGMGNNTTTIRNPDETDFVTQLTMAYTHDMIDDHYVETEPIIYTLSLGKDISLAVMDPAGTSNGINNTSDTIKGYWNTLIANGSTNITVMNSPDGWSAPTVQKTYTVQTTTVNGKTFPQNASQMNYVDKMFTADTAGDLTSVFKDIVNLINVQSEYHPTFVSGNLNLDGYITFIDNIGKYMEVTEIEGILIHDNLFSGADIASNFVSGGGDLGTIDNPTSLGDEMVWAVQQRLGIDTVETARALLNNAFVNGQLSYTSDTEFSNYIGWYANAAGEYLGFYHEGVTTLPEATGDANTDPEYLIKSYGYLGEVDEDQGVEQSDMMYATVQVRESISTGEQTVIFAIPAALIPLVEYDIELDEDGYPIAFDIAGANSPIRLVYEISLKDGINENTINDPDVVDPEYIAENSNADGSVNFYTNQYEADFSIGYGKVNTVSYFRPSRENARYYFRENAVILTDKNGTVYTGENAPDENGIYYFARSVYTYDGANVNNGYIYDRLSASAIATAKKGENNTWYIPAGNVQVYLEEYTVEKTSNETNTLYFSDSPFVDLNGYNVSEENHRFVVGATLGNNGKITIMPASKTEPENIEVDCTINGIKTLEGRDLKSDEFDFVLRQVDADGNPLSDGITDETTNDADGNFEFGKLTFNEAGEYYYTVSEIDNELEGVSYDTTVYNVTVTVTEADGTLSANVQYSIEDKAVEAIEFKNVCSDNTPPTIPEPAETTVELEVLKTLDNRSDKEMGLDGFKFVLKQDGKTILEAVSDENGRAVFNLEYDEDDIGKTFVYEMSEINEGLADMVYSKAVYEYTVKITEDSEGNIIASVTKDGDASNLAAEFVNIYSNPPKPGDASDLIPWIAMLEISCGAVVGIRLKTRRNKF